MILLAIERILTRAVFSMIVAYGCLTALMQAKTYDVGPGKELAEIEAAAWESLEAGDVVNIHWRAEPYRCKWVICRQGEANKPIVVRGIANEQGQLPVIDGRDAQTRKELNFWSETRAVIKIGGSNKPADAMPQHIVIENLEIRSARPPYTFHGRDGKTAYDKNASAIFIEKGEHIIVRNCVMHDSGNGFFTSYLAKDILVDSCFIHSNGIEGSILEHNSYTAAQGITFQFNHYGPLRAECLGSNLKDRSAGLLVKHNWIEGGNRQLDLVDAADSEILRDDPRYRDTWVYGNVLIEREGDGNSQIVHYGGDSDKKEWYRKGTLHFHNNTVVSTRESQTMLFRLSSADERVDCRNNLFYATAGGRQLALIAEQGRIDLKNCWFSEGWVPSRGKLLGKINGEDTCLAGNDPSFLNIAAQDFRLNKTSPLLQGGTEWQEGKYEFNAHYLPHQKSTPRKKVSPLPIGALGAKKS